MISEKGANLQALGLGGDESWFLDAWDYSSPAANQSQNSQQPQLTPLAREEGP